VIAFSRNGFFVAVVLAAVAMALPASAQLGLGLPGDNGSGRAESKQPNPGSNQVDEFARELREDDPVRRLEAVKNLATQKDEKAVELMIEAMSDQDLRVRLKAIECLGNAKASAATPVLIQSLYLTETEPWLKQKVLVALGKIGDSRASQPITDFLSRDVDTPTLGTAVYALGEIGDQSTLDELEDIAAKNEEPSIQRVARDAIAKINQKQIHPEVELRALRNDEDDVRPATASAAPPLAY
jgi:HEAT repeat protein